MRRYPWTEWSDRAWADAVAAARAWLSRPAPMRTPAPDFNPAPEAVAERGRRAQALLEDPVLAAAFDGLTRTYEAAWGQTRSQQVAERERLWAAVQIVAAVQTQLATMVTNGQLQGRDVQDLAEGRRALATSRR